MHGFDRGFDFVFKGVRTRRAHAGDLRLARDFEAPNEHLALVRRFDQTQIDQDRRRVDGLKSDIPVANAAREILRPVERIVHAPRFQGERDARASRLERAGRTDAASPSSMGLNGRRLRMAAMNGSN